MTKKEMLDAKRLAEAEGDSVTITFESSEDACKATVEMLSTAPMDSCDFVLALVDWIQEFAMELHKKAREREN